MAACRETAQRRTCCNPAPLPGASKGRSWPPPAAAAFGLGRLALNDGRSTHPPQPLKKAKPPPFGAVPVSFQRFVVSKAPDKAERGRVLVTPGLSDLHLRRCRSRRGADQDPGTGGGHGLPRLWRPCRCSGHGHAQRTPLPIGEIGLSKPDRRKRPQQRCCGRFMVMKKSLCDYLGTTRKDASVPPVSIQAANSLASRGL